MATKVLGIEIGQNLTRVVEMDYLSKNPKIYDFFCFETPQGVIDDGMVKRSELFTTLMKQECDRHGIRTRKAVFVVSSSRINSRDVTIPFVKENKIKSVIDASAGDFFPVDMNSFHLVHKVLGTTETPEGAKQYNVNLLLVPNDLTASYFDFAKSLNMDLEALDYVGNSIFNVIAPSLGEGTNAIVKVEEENSLILVVKNGSVVLQRTVNYGVDEAVNVVRSHQEFGTNVSYREAIDILSGRTVIGRSGSEAQGEDDEDHALDSVKSELADSFRYLIANVNRVMEFYTSRNADEVGTIYLTGLGADFSGLSKLMTNELNQKVKVFTDLKNVAFGKSIDNSSLKINSYAAAIGAGISPRNLIPEKKKTDTEANKVNSQAQGGSTLIIGTALFVLGLAAAAAMFLYSKGKLDAAKAEKAKVEKNIERMQNEGVEELYEEYVTVGDLNTQLNQIYDGTLSRSEDLVDFIAELEEKLPSNLIVQNFSATNTGVTMSMICDSKEAAAETIMQLRTFDSVDVVSTSGLTDARTLAIEELIPQAEPETEEAEAEAEGEGENESAAVVVKEDENPVSFSIQCVYKAVNTGSEETDVPVEENTEEGGAES